MYSEKSGKILVIDDDKDVLFTARLILKSLFARLIPVSASLPPRHMVRLTLPCRQ
jgi:hypothetical protein